MAEQEVVNTGQKVANQEIIDDKEVGQYLGQEFKDMMLDKFHDIAGIDQVDWWPLAPIYWIALFILTILILILLVIYVRRRVFRNSWQYDAIKELDIIERNIVQLNQSGEKSSESSKNQLSNINLSIMQANAVALSEVIRRIAMQKHSRSACAGLKGEEWLKWLSTHDSRKFDWQKNGKILTEIAYAPICSDLSSQKLHLLINAIKKWVV